MKDLQSEELYFYKIHILLMKSSAYHPLYRQPSSPYMNNSSFLQENLEIHAPMIFQKSQTP